MRTKAWTLFLVALAVHAGHQMTTLAAPVTCGDAVSALSPCGGYLVGSGDAQPTSYCCAGVRRLSSLATTSESRRTLCECFKETGPSFGVNPQRAERLPPFCNVKLSVPISLSVDCDKL